MSLTLFTLLTLTLENKVLRKLVFSHKDCIGADKDVVMVMQRNSGKMTFLKIRSRRVIVRNVRRVKITFSFFSVLYALSFSFSLKTALFKTL